MRSNSRVTAENLMLFSLYKIFVGEELQRPQHESQSRVATGAIAAGNRSRWTLSRELA